eukprot:TRINITY_DN2109_c0_g1_i1.p1 TRINITY_DN2109_c0_g1~~TRINITY_DN2109_c0_g1_i1.p1  ORF type:complete len:340 (+),score=10.00 TRINITY_DN2109_c0_g1_i1:43-1020(+)
MNIKLALLVFWVLGLVWLLQTDSMGIGVSSGHSREPVVKEVKVKKGKVVVAVFPSTVDPERNAQRVETIRHTWGGGVEVVFMGHGDYVLPQNMSSLHQGSTDVIRWMIDKSLQHHPDLQWWVKADDLTYIIPTNLHRYLSTRDSSDIQLLGRRLRLPGGEIFCSGGAGYVLSRSAISFITSNWDKCRGSGWSAKEGGDIALSTCLPKEAIIDTRDEPGGERFSAYGPQRTSHGTVDKWYKDYTPWYSIPSGLACCSEHMITFHYVEYGEAKAIHAVLTRQEEFRKKSDAERLAMWPTASPLLSGYSTKPEESDQMWGLLIDHIKV